VELDTLERRSSDELDAADDGDNDVFESTSTTTTAAAGAVEPGAEEPASPTVEWFTGRHSMLIRQSAVNDDSPPNLDDPPTTHLTSEAQDNQVGLPVRIENKQSSGLRNHYFLLQKPFQTWNHYTMFDLLQTSGVASGLSLYELVTSTASSSWHELIVSSN